MFERVRDLLATDGSTQSEIARALTAYALVEPQDALRFLVAEAANVRERIGAPAVARAIDSALEGLPRDETGLPQGEAGFDATLLRRLTIAYADILSPATLAALLARFPHDVPESLAQAIEAARERSPEDPVLLRAAIEIAERSADFAKADRLLTALGFADNTPAGVASIRRKRRAGVAPTAAVRIALLSSFTVDHLVPFLDLECRALNLAPQIYVAPFNSWAREAIDPASELRRFDPELTILAVSIDDLVPLSEPLAGAELRAAGEDALERVLGVVDAYLGWASGKPLIVHAFHSAFESGPLGIADGRDGNGRREWLAALNAQLGAALAARPGTFLLDVRASLAQSGAALADNPKLRHIAAMRLPPSAFGPLARAYARYIAPLKGLTKKCVVLDLDNTLWGGVVGEDGKDGLRLGGTSPGSEFLEFQQYLAGLTRRGILLALNSKNNAVEALDAIRTHEAMVLREPAFSAIRINWKPKPENMASIAQELNIGLDSLVFVDDNPDEREMMRRMLPDVLTVELPKDPALYRSTLEAVPQLHVLGVTEEDGSRVAQYQAAQRREELKLSAASLDDFLRSLRIHVTIAPASKPFFGRITQLFARTNQFNVTTRRYTAADVERFATDPEWRLSVLSSRDRFGDHGLVALSLVRTAGDAWNIDSLLMSCRVIGYGIETALLAFLAGEAQEAGAIRLRGEFVPTQKNAPAMGLYGNHGFALVASDGTVQHWERSLEGDTLAWPAWIERVQA